MRAHQTGTFANFGSRTAGAKEAAQFPSPSPGAQDWRAEAARENRIVLKSHNQGQVITPNPEVRHILAGYRELVETHAQRIGLKFVAEFDSPIYGRIPLTQVEYEIVTSDGHMQLDGKMQMQIGRTRFGSTFKHTRRGHCIGTLYIAGIAAALQNLGIEETTLLRASDVLHDIGHTPGSHAPERYLRRATGYDHDHMLTICFNTLGIDTILATTPRQHSQAWLKPGTILNILQSSDSFLSETTSSKRPSRTALLGWIVKQFVDRIEYLVHDTCYAPVSNDLKILALKLQDALLRGLRIDAKTPIPYFEEASRPLLDCMMAFREFSYGNFAVSPNSQIINHILERSLAARIKLDHGWADELFRISDTELIRRLSRSADQDGKVARGVTAQMLRGSPEDHITPVFVCSLAGVSPEAFARLTVENLESAVSAVSGDRNFFIGASKPDEMKPMPFFIKSGTAPIPQKPEIFGGLLRPEFCSLYVLAANHEIGGLDLAEARRIIVSKIAETAEIDPQLLLDNTLDLSRLVVPESHVLSSTGARALRF